MDILRTFFPFRFRALLLASAILEQHETMGQQKTFSQTINLDNFKNINVTIGNAEILLIKGEKFSISTESEKAVDRYLKIKVKNNELKIDAKKGMIPLEFPIKVRVTLPGFYSILNTGAAVVRSEDVFEEEAMKIENAGSGSISLSVQLKSIALISSGAGRIALSGKTKDMNCILSGSGMIDAGNLEAAAIYVKNTGSGRCDLFCNDSLTGMITGSGTVRYKGHPAQIKVDISGSGSMDRL